VGRTRDDVGDDLGCESWKNFIVLGQNLNPVHLQPMAEKELRFCPGTRITQHAPRLLGIDRLDYTKGISRRLLAYEHLLVRHPERPDWGLGQVQSVVGARITVNFENAGKLLINGEVISLETVDGDADSSA
jgi:hypothetical protein